jgi:hypothetical protein
VLLVFCGIDSETIVRAEHLLELFGMSEFTRREMLKMSMLTLNAPGLSAFNDSGMDKNGGIRSGASDMTHDGEWIIVVVPRNLIYDAIRLDLV